MAKSNLSREDVEKRAKVKATSGTIGFYILLIALFFFIGFKTPLPLPDEKGIEVMLGNQVEGMGDYYQQNDQPETLPAEPAEATENQPKAANQNIATQTQDEAPVVKENKQTKTTDPNKNQQTNTKTNNQNTQTQRKSNPNFEYTNQGKTPGSGDGKTPGYQGKPGGTPGGEGDGSGGDDGFAWNLAGRGNLARELPQDDGNDEAIVVLEIGVNRQGQVVDVNVKVKGSTVLTGAKVDKAKAAARKWRFTPKDDAPEVQYGTITFRYRLN